MPPPWRQDSGGRNRRRDRPFIQVYDTMHGRNVTARQALTEDEYESLRVYFGRKLDTDMRARLCCYHALVNMLRHANGLDERVELAPDWVHDRESDP